MQLLLPFTFSFVSRRPKPPEAESRSEELQDNFAYRESLMKKSPMDPVDRWLMALAFEKANQPLSLSCLRRVREETGDIGYHPSQVCHSISAWGTGELPVFVVYFAPEQHGKAARSSTENFRHPWRPNIARSCLKRKSSSPRVTPPMLRYKDSTPGTAFTSLSARPSWGAVRGVQTKP